MANIRTRETASGPRYDVKFKFNGRHRMKTFRTCDDARAYKKKVEGEELAGLVVDPKGGERVFETFADAWLEQRLVRGRPLTPATRQGYRAVLRRHLNPEFGGTRLRQITPERVRSWYATLSLASRDQAAKSYRVLRAILNTAVSDGSISKNPCTIRGAGIEHAPERPMLATTMVLQLAESIEPRLRCLILLGEMPVYGPVSSSGCSDGTSTCCTARSRSSASPMRSPARDASPRLQKSDAGYRSVALPRFVLIALEEHLGQHVEGAPDASVFTRPSGLPLRRADLSLAWRSACDAVGLCGVRPHDLRHHAATVIARNPNVTLQN